MSTTKTHYGTLAIGEDETTTACGRLFIASKSNVAMTDNPMRVTCRKCEAYGDDYRIATDIIGIRANRS